MSAVLTRRATPQDVLLARIWAAARSYEEADTAKSQAYGELYDAVAAVSSFSAGRALVRAAVANGTAELGDITSGDLEQIGGAR